ncbi:MAG: TPM domain-containing protein [Candidatus Omnitrophica bacterium]|nr:TPM domain-containing protein [Candidatus Omnitrophota bacterium]
MKIMRSAEPALFFSGKEKEAIVAAIREAEKVSSAEIHVHLTRKARPDIMAHAAQLFERLGLTRTKDRNGVLIFMGVASKRFAILGDEGIHSRVGSDFWTRIAASMSACFAEDRFADGIVEAVEAAGQALAAHFPYQRDDVNELPDEISFS